MGTGKIEKLGAQKLRARKLKGRTFSVVARLRLCGRYEPMLFLSLFPLSPSNPICTSKILVCLD